MSFLAFHLFSFVETYHGITEFREVLMVHFPCFKIEGNPGSVLVEPGCTYVIEDKTERSEARIAGVLELLIILGYLCEVLFDDISFIVVDWGHGVYSGLCDQIVRGWKGKKDVYKPNSFDIIASIFNLSRRETQTRLSIKERDFLQIIQFDLVCVWVL